MTGGFLQRLTGDAGDPPAPAPVLRPVLRGTSPAFEDDASLWEMPGAPAEEAAPAYPTPSFLLSDGPTRLTEPAERQETERERAPEPPAQAARPQSAPISVPPSAEPFMAQAATPAPQPSAQMSPAPVAPVHDQRPAPAPATQGPAWPLQTPARKAPDRSEEPSSAQPSTPTAPTESANAPAARPPVSAEIFPHPMSTRETPTVRPTARVGEPDEAAPLTRSSATVAPALVPRARDAAAAFPLPETPPAPTPGPKIEIGRLVVEVVRDAPEPAVAQAPAPRTAAQASMIGPIGDLRAGLRRFPGWG